MKLVVLCCVFAMAALVGCSSARNVAPAPSLPRTIGNGAGSQYGNYGARIEGEMRGPSGERCVIFDWDRPFTAGFAIRYRSASCEAKERPGWMIARELSRTVIPISRSNLEVGPASP